MGYDLSNLDTGDDYRFNIHGWGPILSLAEKYGWQPAGTVLPGDKDWEGSYYSNDGQIVQYQDAQNIAKALEKALPNLSDVRKMPNMVSYRHNMPKLGDDNEYQAVRRNLDIPEYIANSDISIVKYGHGEGEWYPGKDAPAPYVLVVLKDDSEALYKDEEENPVENEWAGESRIQRVVGFIEFCRKGAFRIY